MKGRWHGLKFSLEEYLEQLKYVVNIDSGSRIIGGTDKVADFFEKLYKELGLSVKHIKFDENLGPCLEIRNDLNNDKIDVLFAGHMDTVFGEGTVSDRPFKRDDDYAYGPGVMDMKAGLLSTYYLVKELIEMNTSINFCIALNSDEEISSISSQNWIKSLAKKSKYAFILEPGRKNGEFVYERKGLARYVVEFHGISAHAGIAPQSGASSIHEMSQWISRLILLNNYEIGTSLNVGKISGGTGANVVCDYAVCHIDTRFDDIEENKKIELELESLLKNTFDKRVKVEVIREGFRPPMRKTENTSRLMELMNKKGEELGLDVKWTKTGGGSDGNFIAFEGCTVIDGAGPAGDGAHSNNEILQIITVYPRIKLLLETIKEIENMVR